MADTTTSTRLRVQQWDDDFFTEYVRESRFKTYMGTDENSIIQVKEDLMKKRGDRLTYNLVNRLTNGGVTGSNTLEGNEESLSQRAHLLTVNKIRNGVRIAEMEEVKSAIDLRDAGRSQLKVWIAEKTRDQIVAALGSIQTAYGTQKAYADASEAEKDAWLVDNSDRVLFGAAISNGSSNDHSTALATLDTTDDLLSPAKISLMKRIAQSANPKIRPIMTKGDEEWYVLFAGPLNIKSLQADSVWTQANREARDRGKDNPLFKGADYVWDGVIIRQIPEIQYLSNVGSGGTVEVEPTYLCGAQSLGIGWAKRTTSKTKEFDYGDKYGVAIEEIRGIEKLHFEEGNDGSGDFVQHGQVTGFFAVTAD
jgi:N4-gp56 family major capsid protein